ncbi:MAG TPA: HEAT repeat domain-containing protein [Pyrinomonadaceae bacterium]|nr:HEAT repeat domain-containing protein [Pyrinomonadaceae bacterium]
MQVFKSYRCVLCATAALLLSPALLIGQDRDARNLTPLQLQIEKQRVRLSSTELEERRDALTSLGSMRHHEASRAAVAALNDPLPIIRGTAASSILSLPSEEAASHLTPLLKDKDEFVRREAAYALGKTGSRSAVSALSELLLTDKEDGVRGAAAVALGQIADEAAVVPLSAVLNPQVSMPASKSKKTKKPRREPNVFVLRSAARSLGQIGSRAGSPSLILVLQDEKAEDDLRRESAAALGRIGDASALPSLRAALTARDPYLAEAAKEAIHRITQQ